MTTTMLLLPKSTTNLATFVFVGFIVQSIESFGVNLAGWTTKPAGTTTTISRWQLRPYPLLLSSSSSSSSSSLKESQATTTTPRRRERFLFMVPRYDEATARWEPTGIEEEASAGYGPFGTLLRQGPVPFVRRILDADEYDQGVLKMMANPDYPDIRTRNDAQGNMDAYLQNPNDWVIQKMEERKGTVAKFDYANANMDPVQLVLTALWTSILLTVVGRVVYVTSLGCDAFCREYHF